MSRVYTLSKLLNFPWISCDYSVISPPFQSLHLKNISKMVQDSGLLNVLNGIKNANHRNKMGERNRCLFYQAT
jgi:hypothetical protein